MPKTKLCWYCGCELRLKFTTQDHQQPVSRGGKNDKTNLVDCCRNCNQEKGNMNVEEYRTFVWLQKMGAPDFTFEQIKFLKTADFVLTVPKEHIPKWSGRFHGETITPTP